MQCKCGAKCRALLIENLSEVMAIRIRNQSAFSNQSFTLACGAVVLEVTLTLYATFKKGGLANGDLFEVCKGTRNLMLTLFFLTRTVFWTKGVGLRSLIGQLGSAGPPQPPSPCPHLTNPPTPEQPSLNGIPPPPPDTPGRACVERFVDLHAAPDTRSFVLHSELPLCEDLNPREEQFWSWPLGIFSLRPSKVLGSPP